MARRRIGPSEQGLLQATVDSLRPASLRLPTAPETRCSANKVLVEEPRCLLESFDMETYDTHLCKPDWRSTWLAQRKNP